MELLSKLFTQRLYRQRYHSLVLALWWHRKLLFPLIGAW